MLRILRYKLSDKVDKRKSRKRDSNKLVKIAFAINQINLKKRTKYATVLQAPFIPHAIILYHANERLKSWKKGAEGEGGGTKDLVL